MSLEFSVDVARQHVVDTAAQHHIELFTSLERARNRGFLHQETYEALKKAHPTIPLDLQVSCASWHPDDHTRRGVIAPPLSNAYGYAVLLHELGHHIAPNGRVRDFNRRPRNFQDTFRLSEESLIEERAAWHWAWEHSLFGWLPDMNDALKHGLKTHLETHREAEIMASFEGLIKGFGRK